MRIFGQSQNLSFLCEEWVRGGEDRERESFQKCSQHQVDLEGQEEVKRQEQHPGLPLGWQKPSSVSHHLWPARVYSNKRLESEAKSRAQVL